MDLHNTQGRARGGREAKLDSWRAEGRHDNDGGEARPHGDGWSDWQTVMASQETYDGDWTAVVEQALPVGRVPPPCWAPAVVIASPHVLVAWWDQNYVHAPVHVGGEREFCRCLSIHLRNGNAPHSHTQYLYSYDANPDGITATHTVGKASGVPCGAHPKNLASSDEKRKEIAEMFELFVLGCTGVVVFIHGANFFFRALSRRLTARPLRKASTLMPKHLIMSSALLYVKMASNEFFFLSAIAFPRRT
ncbi:hypothetical protein BHM03_00009522 [Ensete ventricosum]|nr:hypothetical protein BHM03_00009522 [Ensete ventricosum]